MPEYGLYNGAWTGPEIDAAIGRSARISNLNLLDNAYFIGGGGDGKFPINQRGQATYTGAAYTIDRWKLLNGSGTLSLTSGGIVFSNSTSGYGYMKQAWELGDNVSGMQLTLSVLANGVLYSSTGSFNITLPSGLLFYKSDATSAVDIRIPANLVSSETITAIKVEVGNQQTLAHQEGTSWVLNEIPNYAEELAKCQRYLWIINATDNTHTIAYGSAADTTHAYFCIGLPVTMRQNKAFNVSTEVINDTLPRVYSNSANTNKNASAIYSAAVIGNQLSIGMTIDTATLGESMRLMVMYGNMLGVSCEI